MSSSGGWNLLGGLLQGYAQGRMWKKQNALADRQLALAERRESRLGMAALGEEQEEGYAGLHDRLSSLYDQNPGFLDLTTPSGKRAVAEVLLGVKPGETIDEWQNDALSDVYSLVQNLHDLKSTGKTSFGGTEWALEEGETPEDSLYRAISTAASHELRYDKFMPQLAGPEEQKEFERSSALAAYWGKMSPKSAANYLDSLKAVEAVLAEKGAVQRDPNALLRRKPSGEGGPANRSGVVRPVTKETTFGEVARMIEYPQAPTSNQDQGPTTPQLLPEPPKTKRHEQAAPPVIRKDRVPYGPEEQPYIPGESENSLLGSIRQSAMDIATKLEAGDGLSQEEWDTLANLQRTNLYPQYWMRALQNYAPANQSQTDRGTLEAALELNYEKIGPLRERLAEHALKQERSEKRKMAPPNVRGRTGLKNYRHDYRSYGM